MTGIVAAKWLASLAPPRCAPMTGRPSAAPAAASVSAAASRASMPGPFALHLRVDPRPADLVRDRGEHLAQRLEPVGAHVADELAGGRDDVERLAAAAGSSGPP